VMLPNPNYSSMNFRLWHLGSFRCDAEFGPLSASQRTWLDLPLGRPCSE
jgi:hypothetical protein